MSIFVLGKGRMGELLAGGGRYEGKRAISSKTVKLNTIIIIVQYNWAKGRSTGPVPPLICH